MRRFLRWCTLPLTDYPFTTPGFAHSEVTGISEAVVPRKAVKACAHLVSDGRGSICEARVNKDHLFGYFVDAFDALQDQGFFVLADNAYAYIRILPGDGLRPGSIQQLVRCAASSFSTGYHSGDGGALRNRCRYSPVAEYRPQSRSQWSESKNDFGEIRFADSPLNLQTSGC